MMIIIIITSLRMWHHWRKPSYRRSHIYSPWTAQTKKKHTSNTRTVVRECF